MLLTVARHGETDYNVQERYAGSTDVPLNANGLAQAEALALRLKACAYDVLVCSPLRRAAQTAAVVSRGRALSIVYMPQFKERNMGVYEGLTRAEAHERYPELWARNPGRDPNLVIPGGESLRQVSARVDDALERLRASHADRRVLLVCHGLVAREVNRYLRGLSFDDMHGFSLGNCSTMEYAVDDGVPLGYGAAPH